MLMPPNAVAEGIQRILNEIQSGRLSEAEGGEQMVALDRERASGYLLLGSARAESGDLEEAEALLWKALELEPCHATNYMFLVDVRRKRHTEDVLADRLVELAIWQLSCAREVPKVLAAHFRQYLGEKFPETDFSDPETYHMLGSVAEVQAKDRTDPEEIADRLLPFRLLTDLERQAESVVDPQVVRDLIAHRDRSVPILHAALRSMAQSNAVGNDKAACMTAALLGETGGPEILKDLLEFSLLDDDAKFLHGSWAVFRLGKRFPAEAFAMLRSAIPGASPVMRCAIAEHLYLLPEDLDIAPALQDLLDGFESFAATDDAAPLLAFVSAALRAHGREDLARAVSARYAGLLPAGVRKSFESSSGQSAGALSKLLYEGIDEFDIDDVCLERVFMDEDEEAEEDEEDEGPPAVKPGRNEPCWCGSGKKYKKCHLAADEEYERRRLEEEEEEDEEDEDGFEPAGDADEQRLFNELLAANLNKRSDLRRAAKLYFEDPDEVDSDTAEEHDFIEWYMRDYRSSSTGRTAVEEFLRKHELPPRDRRILEAWRDARFGLYEIERIEEGAGVEVKDLCADDRFFVHDVTSSHERAKWDCMLARVEELDGKRMFSGNGLLVPRGQIERLLEYIETGRKAAGQSAAEFVRANSHRLHRVVTETAREQFENLRVVNAEGDPLEFCSAEYDVRDEAAAIEALRGSDALEPDDPPDDAGVHAFAWLEVKASGPRRSYGRIEIRAGRLTLECNSRQRLEAGKRLLEERAGAFLRHTQDSLRTVDSIQQQILSGKPAAKTSSVPPEVEREIVLKFKTEHYATWPDVPLPALDGRTPRDAVRTPEGRQAVENLLRTMENGEERERKLGRPAFDFAPLRGDLGLG